MHVDVVLLEELRPVFGETRRGLAACVQQRDLGRFLHDAAQLARDVHTGRAALRGGAPGQGHGLDVEHGTAHGRPSQAQDCAGRQFALVEPVRQEDRLAHVVLELVLGDVQLQVLKPLRGLLRLLLLLAALLPVLDELRGKLPANLLDLLLQVPHPGFPAIPPDQRLDRLGVDGGLRQRYGSFCFLAHALRRLRGGNCRCGLDNLFRSLG
mmetsp:Transcript_165664/g.531827  ORF Transcript_165664/g.531827 Transcript_165664/m.531827 type:complete len:210 (-) Transcript_165664:2193-2822(-)